MLRAIWPSHFAAATGATRMRVAMRYNEAAEPCEQFYYGEVEEYGVTILMGSGSGGTCNGNTVLSSCSGSINDGSGNADYSANLYCSWLISPPGASTVTLNFSSFNTESGFDFVRIYDGVNTSGILLGVYSGASLPPSQTANSGNMFIVFETDDTANKPGWSATYTCSNTPNCDTPSGFAVTDKGYAFAYLGWNSVAGASGECGAGNYSSWSASIFVTTLGAGDPYCYSYGLGWDDWIASVSFGAINNNTGKNYGYGNFTNLSTTVTQGGSYPITLTPATDDNAETVYWRVWADFNQDHDFNDAGEQVFEGTGTNGGPVLGSISIPQMAMPGSTRLRISMSLGAYGTACQTLDFREVEEYTILINASAQPPVANFSASATCGPAPLQVIFTDQSSNSPSSWNWSFGSAGTSTQQNPSVVFNTPGVYTVQLNAGNTAGSDAEIKTAYITVTAAPVLSVSPDTAVCFGTPVVVQASGANQFSWTGPGLSANTGSQVSVSPVAPGTYIYQVSGTLSNCPTPVATFTLKFNPNPVVAISVASQNICLGTLVSLTASGANAYSWTGTGLSSNSGAQVMATPTAAGVFTYEATGQTGNCFSQAQTLLLTVLAIPEVSATVSANPLCLGDTLVLQASGASTYSWSGPGLLSSTGSSVKANPQVPGNVVYTVIGANGICDAQPLVVQTNVLDNLLSVAVEVGGCPGTVLTFTAIPQNAGLFPNILWYLNGTPVWGGPSYNLLNAGNGNLVYCEITPSIPQACTHPAVATSNTIEVDCIPLGVGDEEGKTTLRLFPNPNKGDFRLEAGLQAGAKQLRIYNAVGLLVWEQNFEQEALEISLPDKSAGWYCAVVKVQGRYSGCLLRCFKFFQKDKNAWVPPLQLLHSRVYNKQQPINFKFKQHEKAILRRRFDRYIFHCRHCPAVQCYAGVQSVQRRPVCSAKPRKQPVQQCALPARAAARRNTRRDGNHDARRWQVPQPRPNHRVPRKVRRGGQPAHRDRRRFTCTRHHHPPG
ncbi:MAG: PKD domain-containing protein [Lewinellaceae bacterium]|nr:PKD domain-containing protein [Lewinellaceae bacterium]